MCGSGVRRSSRFKTKPSLDISNPEYAKDMKAAFKKSVQSLCSVSSAKKLMAGSFKYYLRALGKALQQALAKCKTSVAKIHTPSVTVPTAFFSVFFEDIMSSSAGGLTRTTKIMKRYIITSADRLSSAFDPAYLKVVVLDKRRKHTIRVLCSTQRPFQMRYNSKTGVVTMSFWAATTSQDGSLVIRV